MLALSQNVHHLPIYIYIGQGAYKWDRLVDQHVSQGYDKYTSYTNSNKEDA